MELLPLSITIPFQTSTSSNNLHKFKIFPFHYKKYPTRLNCKKSLEINSNINNNNSTRDNLVEKNLNFEKWEENDFVEVFGIGSRRDTILDFCTASPSLSTSLRFWNILMKDSEKVQLQQRYPIQGHNFAKRNVEASLFMRSGSKSKAIILVASTGYSNDHITAIDIFKEVKAGDGLVIGIILKPFSFEGQRRQNEVKELMSKLEQHATFCIVIDTDALLEEDMVTLDEAINNSNKAVLMALNAISNLISENIKLFNVTDKGSTELKVSELRKIFESYKQGKIGFGSSNNIKNSLLQAYSCPFLSANLQDMNGVILCILASSNNIDVNKITHTLRSIGFKGQLIITTIYDPILEPELINTTLISFSYGGQSSNEKSSIFSRFARNFPFFFNNTKKQDLQMQNNEIHSDLLKTLMSNNNNNEEISSLRDNEISSEQSNVELFEFGSHISQDSTSFNRELLLRPSHEINEKSVKNEIKNQEVISIFDNVSVFTLPVGVKHTEKVKDCVESVTKDEYDNSDLYNNNNNNNNSPFRKQGVLSTRAASMLEAERHTEKKLSRSVEMRYRGGSYKGQIQGGLPEGKGRLTLSNGSIYDGTWRYGKRSGLGTFYYTNGDFYQGTWRDDVMHGKGWLYFHTGDRWFVNFWKGKANGEGRFYSKVGHVFFGHFKYGWRDGHFLHVSVDGTRCHEVWDEGILVTRTHFEGSDAYKDTI